MELSVVRQRLAETNEPAKKQAAERRGRSERAAGDFGLFLQKVAIPLVRQLANALKADGDGYTVFTPSGSVRMMSDRSSDDVIELSLDSADDPSRVMAQVSRTRGRRVSDTQHAIGAPDALTEEDVLAFLLKELAAFVER